MIKLGKYRKTIVGLIGVGAMIVSQEVGGDWATYILAALTALGVYGVPNVDVDPA